ncbi:flagellar motor protein MotB [Thermosyntropha sp.]|uniref:flagellar motor protein MotB n=1 Tax=Thermosyntropha sp. TaxID=2740820 RepID=UPI0025DA9069|nr:flagellar motor protein MotB [Thermosyntropha sp.]MBO8159024.1 OmpA family protein [Thermosyntropha sp.]
MLQRRKNKEKKKDNHDRWLVTYADLITLLMIFFVLMYTMSRIDAEKYKAVANSLSVVLTGADLSVLDSKGPSIVEGQSGEKTPQDEGKVSQNQKELEEVEELIRNFIKNKDIVMDSGGQGQGKITKLSDYIIVYEQERGLVVSFKDTLLFESGSDELTPQARMIIIKVGEALKGLPNYIRVEGHTDNRPINTRKFPSNWELSVLRAANVVHVLSEDVGIPPEKLSIIGYGEYRPIAPNDDKIGRAMNRRVDIVILKQKYDYFEPHKMGENTNS